MTDSGTGPNPQDQTLNAQAEYLATGAIAEGHAPDLRHLPDARAALQAQDTWHDLPDEVEDLVAQAISDEQSGDAASRPNPPRTSLRVLSAAAAVAALMAFGAGWLVNSQRSSDPAEVAAVSTAVVADPTPAPTAIPTALPTEVPTPVPPPPTALPTAVPVAPPDATAALSATDYAPAAEAVALLRDTPSGVEIELSVEGLPPAPTDGYYQGWIVTNDDVRVTIGTFHLRGDDEPVILWAGLDLEDIKLLTVTVQQLDGGPASSGVVVLRGPISS